MKCTVRDAFRLGRGIISRHATSHIDLKLFSIAREPKRTANLFGIAEHDDLMVDQFVRICGHPLSP